MHIYCIWNANDLSLTAQHSPSPGLSWGKSFGGTCGGEVPGGISSSGLSSICSPMSCSPSGKSPAGCSSSPPSSSGSGTFSSTRSQSWRGAATGGHEWREKNVNKCSFAAQNMIRMSLLKGRQLVDTAILKCTAFYWFCAYKYAYCRPLMAKNFIVLSLLPSNGTNVSVSSQIIWERNSFVDLKKKFHN